MGGKQAPGKGEGVAGPGQAAELAAVLAREAVDNRRQSLDIFEQRRKIGSSSALELTQVRTLLTSQTDLLTRVATLTTKWQQAVAENAALHRQNLQLAARQCL